MAFSKIQELKTLERNELENELIKIEKDLFDLRLKKSTRQDFKSHNFKHLKHKKAQLLTIINNLEK